MEFRAVVRASTRVLPFAYTLFLALNAEAGTAAQPEPRGVAAAFGNTVKAIYPDGKNQRIWLREDGTWEAIGRRGKHSSGKWSAKGSKVCLKQSKPFPAPFKYCTDFPANGGLGAVWASKDMTGVPIKLTLVKGIER
jgi:hypothetical protein